MKSQLSHLKKNYILEHNTCTNLHTSSHRTSHSFMTCITEFNLSALHLWMHANHTGMFLNWKYYVLRKNSKFSDWSLYLRRRPQTHSHHSDPETRLSGKSWRQFPHSTQSGALAQCLFSMTLPGKQSWLYLISLVLLSIDDHRVAGALK